MIYFIQAVNGGPIKIGVSDNVQKRLAQLQTASPFRLKILRTIDGPDGLEVELHERFSTLRTSGEWFKPGRELLDYIRSESGQKVDVIDWKEITANGLWPAPRLCGGVEGSDRRPPQEAQVEMCTRWMRLFASPTKRIRYDRTSYGLKHAVEGWSITLGVVHEQVDEHGRGRWFSERFYVSNGAFIEAARRLDYRMIRTDDGSPNVHFNMKVSLRAKDTEEAQVVIA